MSARRAPAGRLRAFAASPREGELEGAALPRGARAWCVLPEGEHELCVEADVMALCVRLIRLRRKVIERPMHPAGGGARSAPVTLDARGTDLERALIIEVDPLDAPPRTLTLRLDEVAAMRVALPRAEREQGGWLCAYRACEADPIATAAGAARFVEGACALLRDLGAGPSTLTLSTRDEPPRRARVPRSGALDPELFTAALRAIARGSALSLRLDAARASAQIAPSPRGARSVNERSVWIARDAVPPSVEVAVGAALEDLVREGPRPLQCWSARLPEPVTPRCVTRWERAAGLRALPIDASWLGVALRAPAPRAFIDGAWRDDTAAYYPDARGFARALAPRGAGVGSPFVRSMWRRSGGEPLQGGIA